MLISKLLIYFGRNIVSFFSDYITNSLHKEVVDLLEMGLMIVQQLQFITYWCNKKS